MRFVNYKYLGLKNIGIQKNENGNIVPINSCIPHKLATMVEVIKYFSEKDLEELEKKFYDYESIPFESVKLLAPIEYAQRNIFCLGKNYYDHALEIKGKTADNVLIPKEPIYFSKLCYPAIGDKEYITGHVDVSKKVDYEVELAVIIGKSGKNIKKEDVEDYIFGYTIINDVSARDLQLDHVQWYRGKSLEGFCPMGPAIVHKSNIEYPPKLNIKSYVNGELRQDSNTSKLIFNIDRIISELSKGIKLIPGDIIITGTPSGVGMGFEPPKYLKSEDVIECTIEKIGKIINRLK